ncbi:MAG TPA: hypothetical protein VM122_03620 [Usitatibacter sp.]|nr:hypothetical protein [Usitatibacter sp.]
MDTAIIVPSHARYAKCIEASRRVRWEIDKDVIRGRTFDYSRKFLPDGLARIDSFKLASADERRFMSQVQGRTYANMFGLVERFISAKILEVTRGHAFGDQVVVESLVRFTDEELKHQELFRRLEVMMAAGMPRGYRFIPQGNDVAGAVLGKSTWAVLGLTCHIELFSVDHYRQSIDRDAAVSELWKDVFLFHMKEEAQHAVLDEMEWQREDARLTPLQRDQAVGDLIDLVGAVDGLLQLQAASDCEYFVSNVARKVDPRETAALGAGLLEAYRWQYIVSGVRHERFMAILGAMVTPAQMERIGAALAPLLGEAASVEG